MGTLAALLRRSTAERKECPDMRAAARRLARHITAGLRSRAAPNALGTHPRRSSRGRMPRFVEETARDPLRSRGVPRDAPRGIVVAERALGRRVRTPALGRKDERANTDRTSRGYAPFLRTRETYSARVLHFAQSRVSRPKSPIARASDLA